MYRVIAVVLMTVLGLSLSAHGQEYTAERFEGDPPADKLSPDVAKVISRVACRVKKGDRLFCEIWPVAQLPLGADQPNDTVMYQIKPGELVGIIRFPRKTTDFRSQELASGVYTMRYGQQPVDGAHVGTFPTRDFLVLLPGEEDKSPATIEDYKALTKASAAAVGTSHPAIFPLLKPTHEGESIGVRHDEEKDWWILGFPTVAGTGTSRGNMRFEMILVGHAAE